MKPLHFVSAGLFAGALVGFSIAWNIKPAAGNTPSDPASPVQTRAERRPVSSRSPGRAAPSEFSQRWEALQNDEDCVQKREALLAVLGPDKFPGLLAEMHEKAGLFGLDDLGEDQLNRLFMAWYAKTPDAAMAWLRVLPNVEDRQGLLYVIVDEVAETDLEGAVSMLRQDGADELGLIHISDKLLEKAVEQGEDKLLEICELGLHRSGVKVGSTCRLSYPGGFDFKRVLDGLSSAQGDHGSFTNVPTNLVSEWAKRDFQAAWNWAKEGKFVPYNGMSDLIRSAPPADAGAVLAASFNPSAPEDERYTQAVSELYCSESAEMLEAFLQFAPGDRTEHLVGLFDGLKTGNFGDLQALLLERMGPEQRVDALRRNFRNGADPQTRTSLARLLRGLGHSEEEILSLLPERKE